MDNNKNLFSQEINYKKYVLMGLMLLALSIARYSKSAGSAAINISSDLSSYSVGQTFNVLVSINPSEGKIDTARVKLNFSSETLEIKDFTPSSVFTHAAGSNSYDNNTGTFSWGAGVPGGIQKTSEFGTITFKAIKEGDAQITIGSGSLVLAAGENKFDGQESLLVYQINSANTSSQKYSEIKTAILNQDNIDPQNKTDEGINLQTQATIDTQIIPKAEPKSFLASLIDIIKSNSSKATWVVVFLAGALVITAAIMPKAREKTDPIFKKSHKDDPFV